MGGHRNPARCRDSFQCLAAVLSREFKRLRVAIIVAALVMVASIIFINARLKNIDKLRLRYGDSWSQHAALNRSLDAERQSLEGSDQCS